MKIKFKFTLALFTLAGFLATAQSGNVGVGTSSPTEKLEVNGHFKDSAFSTTWTPSISYDSNYVVLYNGRLYQHLTTNNTATAPDMDGSNWGILNSSPTTEEVMTITSTGTAPAKATNPIHDYISATDDGEWVTVDFEYSHTNNAGAVGGTGECLFKLPAGYAFNTAKHPVNTQSTTLTGQQEVHKLIHLSGIIQGDNTYYSYRNYIVPYDATHFRIVNIDVNTYYFVGISFVITHAVLTYKGSFRFKKA